jgi:hypothetical protein
MNTLIRGTMVAFAGLLTLYGCASNRANRPEAPPETIADSNAQLPQYRIRDFSARDDHTIIVVSDDGTRYRAETLGPCIGLGFAHRLAFVNRSGFSQVDRFSSVVLDDGTRCALQSFSRLQSAESKALDDYEKSGDKAGGKNGEKDAEAESK